MAVETKSLTPPYLSVPQLKNFIKQLAETAVPIKIDRGVIGSLSGSSQAALNSALRFLGLINEEGSSLTPLRELVAAYKAGEHEWKAVLKKRLDASYSAVVKNADLENGTWKTLEDAFIAAGVREGQMSEKATRFYVAALVEAGAKVSHYITQAKGRSTGSGSKQRAKRAETKNGGDFIPRKEREDDTSPLPEGFIEQPVHLPDRPAGAVVRFPKNITEEECAFFEHALTFVVMYAKRNGQKGSAE